MRRATGRFLSGRKNPFTNKGLDEVVHSLSRLPGDIADAGGVKQFFKIFFTLTQHAGKVLIQNAFGSGGRRRGQFDALFEARVRHFSPTSDLPFRARLRYGPSHRKGLAGPSLQPKRGGVKRAGFSRVRCFFVPLSWRSASSASGRSTGSVDPGNSRAAAGLRLGSGCAAGAAAAFLRAGSGPPGRFPGWDRHRRQCGGERC